MMPILPGWLLQGEIVDYDRRARQKTVRTAVAMRGGKMFVLLISFFELKAKTTF